MSSFTINVQDYPISSQNNQGTIVVSEPDRSQVIDPDGKIYKIATIRFIDSLDSTQSFNIVVQHSDDPTNPTKNLYIQIPVKLGNVSKQFINPEFTEFIEDANATGSKPFQFNVSELFNALPNDHFLFATSNNEYLIKTSVVYLNVPMPTTTTSTIDLRGFVPLATTTVTIKTKAPPLSFRLSSKTTEANPDSKDPSRTIPITIYENNNKDVKNDTNPDNIHPNIISNLNTYTGLIIFCIVVGFIIVTAYIILIMIPDSKLHIIKPRVNGGGRWSFCKIWKSISQRFSN